MPYSEFVQYDLSCFPASSPHPNPNGNETCDGTEEDACFYQASSKDYNETDPTTVKKFNQGEKCYYTCLGDLKYSDTKLNNTALNDFDVPNGYMGTNNNGFDPAENKHYVTCQCFHTQSTNLVNDGMEGTAGTDTEGNPKSVPQPALCIWVFHPIEGGDPANTQNHVIERKNWNDPANGPTDTSNSVTIDETIGPDGLSEAGPQGRADAHGNFLMCGYKPGFEIFGSNCFN